jgi:hypothetical protein
VLYSGEYLLAHRDPASAKGDFNTGWSGSTKLGDLELRYSLAPAGPLTVAKSSLLKGIEIDPKLVYPADQSVTFDPLPKDARVLMKVGDTPMIVWRSKGHVIHVTNRFFNCAYKSDTDALETIAFAFLKNLVIDSGVTVRVDGPALVRVKEGFPYGSYGITGSIAWNTTGSDLTLHIAGGQPVTIPAYRWLRLQLPR